MPYGKGTYGSKRGRPSKRSGTDEEKQRRRGSAGKASSGYAAANEAAKEAAAKKESGGKRPPRDMITIPTPPRRPKGKKPPRPGRQPGEGLKIKRGK